MLGLHAQDVAAGSGSGHPLRAGRGSTGSPGDDARGGGQNVWLVGGGELVGRFADCSLLDEVFVGIAPVTLGAGAPLLPRRLTAADLELVDVARDKQFVRLSYRLRG